MELAQMQKIINVVFTVDEGYIQHFCVACTSLLENNRNIIGRIFLVQDIDENNSKLKKTINFLRQKYNIEIEKLSLDSRLLDNFKITHHVSKATYFRLLLPNFLPKDIETVMFLDSDIIVNGSLDEILKLDFLKENNISSYKNELKNIGFSGNHEYYLFAVDHKYSENDLIRLRRIGFKGNKYFNAGVMYINLKKWRKENISKVLIKNATQYNEHLLWWDQDVLNITFNQKWGELDFKFNAFSLKSYNAEQDFKIIHYAGSSKPWHFRNNHPYKYLYWKYLRMTPFKRYIPEDFTLVNIIKSIIPNKLRHTIKRVINRKNIFDII